MMRRAPLAAVIAIEIGCGGPTTAPTPRPTGPTGPRVVSVRITGNTNLTAVGDTSQLAATATYSDGKTDDVTRVARWTGGSGPYDGPVATVVAGLLTAQGIGETTVSAFYGSDSANTMHDTVPVRVLPPGTYILKGTVREPGSPVQGARVAILDGLAAAVYKTTDFTGAYRIPGVGGTFTLRVSKDGYVPQDLAVSMTQDQVLDVELAPTRLPGTIPSGIARVTFTVSGSCTAWPDDVKSRTYDARLVQDGARLDVTLSGPGLKTPAGALTESKFSGHIVGQTVTFAIGGDYYGLFDLVEQLSTTRYFALFGSATGAVAGASLSGTLAGSFRLFDHVPGPNNDKWIATCAAADHQFVFTR